MKAIIFARVSSKDQEEGQSIPAQVRRLTEYAIRKNFTIEKTYQVTESSTKDTRKQFDQIIQHIKKTKEPIALITDTVDRLQRSFRETPLLDDLRKKGHLELHFFRENLIVNQQSNSAQLQRWDIGVLFASGYVRQLGDNVKRSQEECLRNGQWISKAPFGYKNISLPSGKRTIEIAEQQATFVTQIFELYAQGNNSFHTIAEKLKPKGLKSSRGKKVSARTIELVLKNKFYYGVMHVNGKDYPHKYPGLITRAFYDRVQSIIKNHHKAPAQYAGKPILLRGLITCIKCGCMVTGDVKKQKYTYYSCNNSKRICTKRWIREEKLLAEILHRFDQIKLSDKQIIEIVDSINHWESTETELQNKALSRLNDRLDLVKQRTSKLIDMHIDGNIDSETYHFKLDEYKREQQAIMVDIQSYSSEQRQADVGTAETVLILAQKAKEIFMSSNLDEKQQLLNFIFSNFTLNDEKLDVELKEPFNNMVFSEDQHIWRG